MDNQNYRPQNILITGGAGFIGSHVATRLAKMYPEYKVVVVDKLDCCATLNNLQSIEGHPNFKMIKGDIQSPDLLNYILQQENIDTVMHFAAQTHVDNSFGNSLTFTMNNTFDEVYGETSVGKARGLTESSRLEPTNPYSAAKAGAEMLALAYSTSYKLPVIITRGNNVYGPCQFPEKLVPKLTILASRGEKLPIHGDGESVRSYLYVEDVARAFDVIMHRVAKDICKIFQVDAGGALLHVKDRAFNDRRYFICDKKLAGLGWEEETTWEDGLRKTVDWYLKYGHGSYWDNGNLELALEAHPMLAPLIPKIDR